MAGGERPDTGKHPLVGCRISVYWDGEADFFRVRAPPPPSPPVQPGNAGGWCRRRGNSLPSLSASLCHVPPLVSCRPAAARQIARRAR